MREKFAKRRLGYFAAIPPRFNITETIRCQERRAAQCPMTRSPLRPKNWLMVIWRSWLDEAVLL
jgi:hypothetical protein